MQRHSPNDGTLRLSNDDGDVDHYHYTTIGSIVVFLSRAKPVNTEHHINHTYNYNIDV